MDMCQSVLTEFIATAYISTIACLKYGKMIGSYVFCMNIVIYLVNFPELNRVCHISRTSFRLWYHNAAHAMVMLLTP